MDYRGEMELALGNGFAIERELGGAGASQVFVAEELALGRRVVIKMLPKSLTSGVNIERFRREIAVAARLQHPHLVPLLTAGAVTSSGVPWFSMPFVEGESLRELLARRGAMSVGNAARLMREIALALAYAHGRGIVHRDIKPENVLLSDGVAMITDFGVAMAVDTALAEDGGKGGRRLTGAGTTLGTPAYSAPEQIASAGAVDHRADLYSFGCVAYEMLTGSPPFVGRNLRDVLIAQVNERPEPLERHRPGLPPAIVQIVMRCLEKDPAARPQSATDIVKVIDGLTLTSLNETGEVPAVASDRVRVTPVSPTPTQPPPALLPVLPASRLMLAAVVLVVLLAAVMLLR
ncbi:MAG: serine/threonine protein kinase [Gemmatimonadaceae bacterium]|nr:serine/threonine protein kinase [Gemmatimonadaceae bacterium]